MILNGSLVHRVARDHTGSDNEPNTPVYDGGGLSLTLSRELTDTARGSALLELVRDFTGVRPHFTGLQTLECETNFQ